MPDAETPQFRVSNEGEPIPPVDPEDLKRRWNTRKERSTCEVRRAAQSQEADSVAVTHRFRMLSSFTTFNHGELLAPWKHGEDLDDAVFRVAATFPIRPLRQEVYKVPGDSTWGFDPNAFVEKLIEETGISHTWKPVIAKLPADNTGCIYMKVRTTFGPEATKKFMAASGSEQETNQDARELLWAVWTKCQPNLSRASGDHELHVASVAWHFADYAIDNIDLAREFVSRMNGIRGGEAGEGRPPLSILLELERNAVWLNLECSVCRRLMREHSDEERAHCSQALPHGSTPYRWRTHAIEFSDQSAMHGDIAVALLSEDGEQLSALQSCLEATRVGHEVFSHVGFPTGPNDSILHQLQESRAQVVVVGVSPRDVQRAVRVIELLRATNIRPLAIFASYLGQSSTDAVAIMRAGAIAYFPCSSTGSDLLKALTTIMRGARWRGRDGEIEGLEIT